MHIAMKMKPSLALNYDQLNDFQGNLKDLSEENYQRLKKEIIETGFAFSPHVWKNPSDDRWYLLDGHQRVRVIKRLIEEEKFECPPILCVPIEADSLKQAKRRVLQGVSQYGHITGKGLKSFLVESDFKIDDVAMSFDFPDLEFPEFVKEHFRNPEDVEKEESIPDVPFDSKVKFGEIYTLGSHRLMCGSSTIKEDVARLMGEEKADLVFTDPPYGVNYDGGHATEERREHLANDHSTEIYTESVPNMFHFSKPKAALYLWFACSKSMQVMQVMQANNYDIRSWLIWNKNMAQFGAIGAQYKQKHEPCIYAFKKGEVPNWFGPNNEVSVWDISRASKNEFHPTQKPVLLSERAIQNSCPEGGSVLDLFGGSGSTLIGCEKTKRNGYMMELSPAYCHVILDRWAAFAGQDPKREDGISWSQIKNS